MLVYFILTQHTKIRLQFESTTLLYLSLTGTVDDTQFVIFQRREWTPALLLILHKDLLTLRDCQCIQKQLHLVHYTLHFLHFYTFSLLFAKRAEAS